MPIVHAAVLIGRFQPPHLAHLELMRAALARHGRLLVLLGSANMARSVNNPFGAGERARMIRLALGEQARHIRFRAIPDRFDPELWATEVRASVAAAGATDPVLVGFEKDSSSGYLRWFPDWPLEALPGTPGLHATDLRAALWRQDWDRIAPLVHASTLGSLGTFSRTLAFQRLVAEDRAVQLERARHGPGHLWHEHFGLYLDGQRVALVRRAGPIGAGLLSLPRAGEDPGPLLGVFDHPARSLLGPSVARVEALGALPLDARLMPTELALARPRRFFEDHAIILTRLLSRG